MRLLEARDRLIALKEQDPRGPYPSAVRLGPRHIAEIEDELGGGPLIHLHGLDVVPSDQDDELSLVYADDAPAVAEPAPRRRTAKPTDDPPAATPAEPDVIAEEPAAPAIATEGADQP